MSESTTNKRLVESLREMESRGATLTELLDLVHDWHGVPKYNRGVVLGPFHAAFGLHPLDFTTILFACEIFGDGASVSIEETERDFRRRLAEIREKEDG